MIFVSILNVETVARTRLIRWFNGGSHDTALLSLLPLLLFKLMPPSLVGEGGILCFSWAGGVGSIPANSDAQNVPCFRRWRFEIKLSPFFGSRGRCGRSNRPQRPNAYKTDSDPEADVAEVNNSGVECFNADIPNAFSDM